MATGRDGQTAEIPLPQVSAGGRHSGWRAGIVAVNINITSISHIEPGWTYAIPNRNDWETLPPDVFNVFFHRPTRNGRVLGVPAGIEAVDIRAVPSMELVKKLILADGWSCRQTDNGIFTSQLIERLGGPGSMLANQPGIRSALEAAASSPNGQGSGKLAGEIEKHRGAWSEPGIGEVDRAHRGVSAYTLTALRHLLDIGILQPVLPIVCPRCKATTARRPEDLASEMKCEMCLRQFPLGLSLDLNSRNDWLYQLAGHVNLHKLREILPIMATIQILTTLSHSGDRMELRYMVPHVLDVEVKMPGTTGCEVDIISIHNNADGTTTVVVGEAKNANKENSVGPERIQNLKNIQRHLRTKGVECYILVAVMRALTTEEKVALREASERLWPALSPESRCLPILPIVLTEKDLSIPYLHEDHPTTATGPLAARLSADRTDPAQGELAALAELSCRRNLGLASLEEAYDDHGLYFLPRWRE